MITLSNSVNSVTLIRVLLLNVTLYLAVELTSYNKEIRCSICHHIEAVNDSFNSLRQADSPLCLFNDID